MSAFCAVFPWCSPTTFWALTLDEYTALKPWVDAHAKGG